MQTWKRVRKYISRNKRIFDCQQNHWGEREPLSWLRGKGCFLMWHASSESLACKFSCWYKMVTSPNPHGGLHSMHVLLMLVSWSQPSSPFSCVHPLSYTAERWTQENSEDGRLQLISISDDTRMSHEVSQYLQWRWTQWHHTQSCWYSVWSQGSSSEEEHSHHKSTAFPFFLSVYKLGKPVHELAQSGPVSWKAHTHRWFNN